MNYAAVFKLAVVFICNNNRWAISTPLHEQMTIENVADRAAGYGMPGAVCDGNNVLEVYDAVKKAVDHAREGLGPSLVECKTMRMAGHGTHDRAKYVPDAELEEWKKKDPMTTMESILKQKGFANDADLKKIVAECQTQVEKATEKVKEWTDPVPKGQLKDVFHD